MNFEAGQTRSVPRDLFDAAIKGGLVPEGPLDMPTVVANDPRPQEVLVADDLVLACKKLIARGDPSDFTIHGVPRAASVKKLVDFDFKAAEVQRAHEQAMFEVENNGDESTEHTEPSIDTP